MLNITVNLGSCIINDNYSLFNKSEGGDSMGTKGRKNVKKPKGGAKKAAPATKKKK